MGEEIDSAIFINSFRYFGDCAALVPSSSGYYLAAAESGIASSRCDNGACGAFSSNRQKATNTTSERSWVELLATEAIHPKTHETDTTDNNTVIIGGAPLLQRAVQAALVTASLSTSALMEVSLIITIPSPPPALCLFHLVSHCLPQQWLKSPLT